MEVGKEVGGEGLKKGRREGGMGWEGVGERSKERRKRWRGTCTMVGDRTDCNHCRHQNEVNTYKFLGTFWFSSKCMVHASGDSLTQVASKSRHDHPGTQPPGKRRAT